MRGVAFLFALLTVAGVAVADQNSAFQDGKSFGDSTNQNTFSGINSGNVQDKIPGYGTSPTETQYFQGGQGQLAGPGMGKIQACASGTPDSDPIKRQECEAVNFLARNPQVRPHISISNNDPMVTKAKDIGNNAESFFQSTGLNGTGTNTQCTTRTETTPGQYTTQTCSNIKEIGQQQCTMGRTINIDADANFQCDQTINAYESLKCRRGFSPDFGLQVDTSTYTPSFGNEVPPWTGRTFTTSINIDQQATSWTATLSRYQVDNYGQLWINGEKVYENRLYTFPGDIRDSTYGCVLSYDPYNDYYYNCGLMKDGNIYPMWDDGCNSGCRGLSPNIDISSKFHKGENTITLVCVNANSIGPCYATINITSQRVVVKGATVVNGCEALEARAK